MKSTIKIGRNEFDRPVIIAACARNSDDLRDETLVKFINGLNHTSNFCTIECTHSNDTHNIWHIKSIGELDELKRLRERLNETIRVIESMRNKNTE